MNLEDGEAYKDRLTVIYLVNKKESMEVENSEEYSIVGDECEKKHCVLAI